MLLIQGFNFSQLLPITNLARASMTTSDVNNQWRSNFQQQIN
jgi:hypothetical protein